MHNTTSRAKCQYIFVMSRYIFVMDFGKKIGFWPEKNFFGQKNFFPRKFRVLGDKNSYQKVHGGWGGGIK